MVARKRNLLKVNIVVNTLVNTAIYNSTPQVIDIFKCVVYVFSTQLTDKS